MKAIASFEHAPLGLVGHLRAAIEAWQNERAIRKASAAKTLRDVATATSMSHLSAAERHEGRRTHGTYITEPGDVLSGLVLNWPSPSRKDH
ncbi:hypothetical protein [Thalassospira profundimaris]|uniref:hypothetical protein n=1 Tax=Thalassospira profundimaris TaxID=502049 RepID=UPI0002871AFC|nr:hypothetical protein [Thalassospira profundimaris]EKF08183.1 hypothetical protein TH2_11784 [Thalassospira profundimaris WP0211]